MDTGMVSPPAVRGIHRRSSTDVRAPRFVKHYSPYCHHCIAIAPAWQTLYEFYYVSTIHVT